MRRCYNCKNKAFSVNYNGNDECESCGETYVRAWDIDYGIYTTSSRSGQMLSVLALNAQHANYIANYMEDNAALPPQSALVMTKEYDAFDPPKGPKVCTAKVYVNDSITNEAPLFKCEQYMSGNFDEAVVVMCSYVLWR